MDAVRGTRRGGPSQVEGNRKVPVTCKDEKQEDDAC